MRCTSPVRRSGTAERIGGAGKALSESDAEGVAFKRKTRSSGWPCGGQDKVNKVKATEWYYEEIFKEPRELEEKRSNQALVLVQKKRTFCYDVKVNGKKRRVESDKKWV